MDSQSNRKVAGCDFGRNAITLFPPLIILTTPLARLPQVANLLLALADNVLMQKDILEGYVIINTATVVSVRTYRGAMDPVLCIRIVDDRLNAEYKRM